MQAILETIQNGVIEGNSVLVVTNVQAALDQGIAPSTILEQGLIAAMQEVGSLFEEGEYFVPELLVAARAMKAGLALLRPLLVAEDIEPAGKVVIGTVRGDMHDIGKNLVGMMLEGAGFEVHDLGVNVAPDAFVDAVRNDRVDIIALSALLTTTMSNMEEVIRQLKQAGLRDKVKVLVGGAPVTEAFAQRIGADGFAPDASQTATLAKSLVA